MATMKLKRKKKKERKQKTLAPWKESFDKPRQHIQKQKYHFVAKAL